MILLHGDCLEKLKELPDNSIDLCLTDPPYGTTHCKWDEVISFDPMWKELKRIVKLNGAICLFGTEPFSSKLRLSNIKMFKYDWIWMKSNGGGFLNANKQPLKRHESISVFYKKQVNYYPQKTTGKLYTCTRASAGETTRDQNVSGWKTENDGTRYPLSYQKFKSETGFHPTQKPVGLLEFLIKTYTAEGETVLDFAMGSGSTGVAAQKTNRKFIGIEKDKKYFEVAKRRIDGAK